MSKRSRIIILHCCRIYLFSFSVRIQRSGFNLLKRFELGTCTLQLHSLKLFKQQVEQEYKVEDKINAGVLIII